MLVSDIQKEILDMQIDISCAKKSPISPPQIVASTTSAFSISSATTSTIACSSNKSSKQDSNNGIILRKLTDTEELHTPFNNKIQDNKYFENAFNIDDAAGLTIDVKPQILHQNNHQQKDQEHYDIFIKDEIKMEPAEHQNQHCKSAFSKLKVATDTSVPTKLLAQGSTAENSSRGGKSDCETKVENVKSEMSAYDIESEITPSFIMKNKSDSPPRNVASVVVNSAAEFSPIEFLCSPVASSNSGCKSKTDASDSVNSSTKEPYDEWFCIQKELNLINEKRIEQQHKSNNTSGGLFNSASLKLNSHDDDHSLRDLFINESTENVTQKNLLANASPLSELFNKIRSEENRLEEMFDDDPDMEKTNELVETRLEALFHESLSPPTAISASKITPAAIERNPKTSNTTIKTVSTTKSNTSSNNAVTEQLLRNLSCSLMSSQIEQSFTTSSGLPTDNNLHPTMKRQWEGISGSLNSPTQFASSPAAKRSCIVSSFMEEQGNRILMDCQQQQQQLHQHHQQHQQQLFDFSNNHDLLGANDEMEKRTWNTGGSGGGDNELMINNLDNFSSNKKMIYSSSHNNHHVNNDSRIHHDIIDRDILGLSTSPYHPLDNSPLINLNSDHTFDNLHSLPSCGSGATGNMHSMANTNSMSSNFDDDINRHVQNAIDSILNLQHSEADALHFSLDQAFMTENLYGNTTGAIGPSTTQSNALSGSSSHGSRTHHHYHSTTMHHHNNHQVSTLKRRHNRLDDISDCLISGGGSGEDSGGGMMIDSPPPLPPSSGTAGATSTSLLNSDFNIAGGIDEAIKSIMTS